MLEIIDIVKFKELKNSSNGFIAITDKNLPKNCVHRAKCYEVNERYFNQKVIKSNRKNGSYYYTEDLDEVFNKFDKMEKCKTCF